ncbi:hypothetical protein [Streptacidiphilus sp. EB103A]|uniref:hypothetical protein n=1 Tax=Streptacidiphilus sp. EB103A TaxID=3156275 RepID=UPI0035146AA7
MSQTQQAVTYTDAQLHARACVRCGTEDGPLERNGYVETETRPGVRLPWAVVACPDHLGAER